MKTHTFNSWTINEHPNPEKVYDWVRNNWHDLGEHYVEEFISSLKDVASQLNVEVDYCVGLFPDRQQFIKFSSEIKEKDLEKVTLSECYVQDIVEAIRHNDVYLALGILHKEGDWVYSNEGIKELCEANEYDFDINGKFIP